jgi:hypothetical protein
MGRSLVLNVFMLCVLNCEGLLTSAPAGNMGECVTEGPSAPKTAGLMGSFEYGIEFGQRAPSTSIGANKERVE